MGMLTEHFAEHEFRVNFNNGIAELSRDEKRIRTNALVLCQDIMEPIRKKAGEIFVTSGFRDMQANKHAQGQEHSFHLYVDDEAACDFVPITFNLRMLFNWICLGSGLNFDKVILEMDKKSLAPMCIHVQYFTVDKDKNRRQAFEGYTHNQGDYMEVPVI